MGTIELGLLKFSLSGPSDSQCEAESAGVGIPVTRLQALAHTPGRPSQEPPDVLSS